MARSRALMTQVAALVAFLLPLAHAGFDPSSKTNIEVYWGQNSYGQDSSQQRLSYYCSNTDIDIIPLAFLDEITTPVVNFANAGNNCSSFADNAELLDCPQIEADIEECQSTYGKTIVLSIGGATYTQGGFTSSSAAVAAAETIWAMFGPVQSNSSVDRPFGDAVVDGFDFDFESTTENMAPFAAELRSLMTAATDAGDKQYYLSAAPQCPYPDAADNDMLNGTISFDWISVQFYNNYCGVNTFVVGDSTQAYYNFDTWDTWAQTVSANPDVKVLLGIPANTGAAGSGYTTGTTLEDAIEYSETFSSFGGIMMWDMSQLYENSGFLDEVVADLEAGASGTGPATTTTAPTTTATTLTTSTTTGTVTTTASSSTGTPVAQWGQCGGTGYTGSTTCASPYSCECLSVWWCQCE
ncbi:glycoside hydrolase family 18 /Carbohydrate-binding module family 1 [Cryphonectria parasitica EP155]|uniref:chitinase n=1 Tax=Cryphonectria parasitica (strain ATCC 38755 / EP155) TaxID=660469 RepID=A0A9P4Y5E6_CRYP1|nr:glycoside hydrolase family 18 /Carbohydrate-binding module family 1 [Cryphonectria parasitica EP155]KAF3766868.1 glycoside hydrolase family 18 /Carbohydrate-binding module family 1 [Cryphonectria parasitica EP155]